MISRNFVSYELTEAFKPFETTDIAGNPAPIRSDIAGSTDKTWRKTCVSIARIKKTFSPSRIRRVGALITVSNERSAKFGPRRSNLKFSPSCF